MHYIRPRLVLAGNTDSTVLPFPWVSSVTDSDGRQQLPQESTGSSNTQPPFRVHKSQSEINRRCNQLTSNVHKSPEFNLCPNLKPNQDLHFKTSGVELEWEYLLLWQRHPWAQGTDVWAWPAWQWKSKGLLWRGWRREALSLGTQTPHGTLEQQSEKKDKL